LYSAVPNNNILQYYSLLTIKTNKSENQTQPFNFTTIISRFRLYFAS